MKYFYELPFILSFFLQKAKKILTKYFFFSFVSLRLAMAVTAAAFFFSCTQKKDTVFETVADNTEPRFAMADIKVENFSVEQLSQTQSEWKLDAARAYVFYDQKKTFVQKVHLLYHTSALSSTTTIADSAIVINDGEQIILEDNVSVKTNDGKSLSTEQLIWDEQNKKIYTEKPVTLRYKNGDTLYGQNGLRADQNLEKVEIFSGRGIHK